MERPMTTNEEFNQLRNQHGIGITESAAMMDANINTVKCWCQDESTSGFHRMPTYALKLFKLMLEKR